MNLDYRSFFESVLSKFVSKFIDVAMMPLIKTKLENQIMKNVSISLGLILTLTASQSALADLTETQSYQQPSIETIIVTSKSDVANFEIYSEKLSQKALKQALNLIIADIDNDNTGEISTIPSNNSSI